MTALLRNRPYRMYWMGQVMSQLGSDISVVALAFAVFAAGGGPADLGLVLAARMIPQPLLAVVGGAMAYRTSTERVMVGAHLTSGLSQSAAAVLLLSGTAQVWHLILLALVTGAANGFFVPAQQSVVPQIVGPELLQQANAMLRFPQNASKMAGRAVGGIVVAFAGPGWAIACDALSFFCAALLLSRVGVPLLRKESTGHTKAVKDVAEGWRVFRSQRWMWVMVLQNAIALMLWLAGVQVMGPVYATEELGGPQPWGLAVTALAVGLAVGSAVAMAWRPRCAGPLICGCMATMALPMAVMATHGRLAVLSLAMLIAGAGVDTAMVTWTGLMQERIPVEQLSRVLSFSNVGPLALVPLGYVLAGPAVQVVGLNAALALSATGILAVAVIPLVLGDIRTLSRPQIEPRTREAAVA
ncbi:MFS transporter [Streptomyces sp. MMG1121]|uniref:MFS transporter n=1 Tax=Streptomyces sp. MMG1121 TaxID=1415544 RepID=UPI00131D3569|nr:MFS transporter [Streptomyces sp. MMG1121]